MNLQALIPIGMTLLKIVILLGIVAFFVAYAVWLERRFLGFFQSRLGPNRVGPAGLIQPMADGLKLILKEDIIPANARPFLFKVAPMFAIVPAFVGFAIICFAPTLTVGDRAHSFIVADVNLGILFIMAIGSLGVFGIILGGWSSGSKYPLMGSLRSASQMLAYEVPLTLAILSVILMAGSFKLEDIMHGVYGNIGYFAIPLILALGVYLISAVAETNRAPFDLPEAESELVAGFHTEYSGMRFAFYFLAEYANIILVCCVAASLFLGGYLIPFFPYETFGVAHPVITSALGVVAFGLKAVLFLYFYLWIRATFPRYRYDQLLKIGWTVLLPIALVNLFLVAGIKLYLLR